MVKRTIIVACVMLTAFGLLAQECVKDRLLAKYCNIRKGSVLNERLLSMRHPLGAHWMYADLDGSGQQGGQNIQEADYRWLLDRFPMRRNFLEFGDTEKQVEFLGAIQANEATVMRIFRFSTGDDYFILAYICSSEGRLRSVVELDAFTNFMMTSWVRSQVSGDRISITAASPADVTVTPETMKELTSRERNMLLYGTCISLRVRRNGSLSIGR